MAIMKRPLAHLVIAVWCALCVGRAFVDADHVAGHADASASAVGSAEATFQVSLHYDYNSTRTDVQRCAGALLADDWVITAASCLCSGNRSTCNDELNRWRVRFGSNLLDQTVYRGVSRIEIHPNWTGIATDGYDVALFRLNGSASALRANMRAIALPSSYEWSCADQEVGIYGWGVGGLVNQLVVAPAVIVTDWVILATRQFLNQVNDQFDRVLAFWACLVNPNCVAHNIAVQYLDQRIGLCTTDIGAPLVSTSFNQSILLGVASFRFAGEGIVVDPAQPCVGRYANGSTVPVVFTEIDSAEAWIRSFIANTTVVVSVCGDGRIGPNEQCDDMNTISGDGCSANCLLEQDWVCTPGSAMWAREIGDDDDKNGGSWYLRYVSNVDFCTPSMCRRMTHENEDDDGSSGSIIALIIVLSILGGLIILGLIVFCCMRRRKRKSSAEVPVVPVEAVVPMAPMVSIPASPMVAAPPSTPAQGVVIDTWSAHALPPVVQQEIVTPVQLEVITPTYGMPTSEVMPPIVQREDFIEAPRVEQTAMVGPPTWLKE